MKILVKNALTDMMVLKIKTTEGEDVSENLSNILYILKKDVTNRSKEAFTNEAKKQLSSRNIDIDEEIIKFLSETFGESLSLSIGNSFNEARQKLSVINTDNSYRDLNLMMRLSKNVESSVKSSSSSNFESSIKNFVSSFK